MILSGLVQATRQMPQDMTNTEMVWVITVCVLAGAILGYGIYATFHTCQPRKGGGGRGNGGGFDPTGYDPKPPKGGIYGVHDQVDDTPLYVPSWFPKLPEKDKQDA